MQQHLDVGVFPVEAVLLVADITDGEPRHMGDVVARDRRGTAGLARDHDTVRGCKGLAGNANVAGVPAMLRRRAEEGVDDLVGNAVADLVGMAFGHGFTGEQVG